MAVEKWLEEIATVQREMESTARLMEAGEKTAYNLTTQKYLFKGVAKLLAEVPHFVGRGSVDA